MDILMVRNLQELRPKRGNRNNGKEKGCRGKNKKKKKKIKKQGKSRQKHSYKKWSLQRKKEQQAARGKERGVRLCQCSYQKHS